MHHTSATMRTKLADKVRANRSLPAPEIRRAIRLGARLSQQDIADAMNDAGVGITRATVSRWETGDRRPRGEALVRYTEILRSLQEFG